MIQSVILKKWYLSIILLLNNRKICLSITFPFLKRGSHIHSFIHSLHYDKAYLSLIFTALEFIPNVLEMSLVYWIKGIPEIPGIPQKQP